MNTTSNNDTFQHYLKDLFRPAQDWALSEEGSSWISKNIPTLKALMQNHYEDKLFGVYSISLNGKYLYIGESIKTIQRLVVHAYNICHFPELFGLGDTLGKNSISVTLLATGLSNAKARKEEEVRSIYALKPVLQKGDGTDMCISIGERHRAVLPYLEKHDINGNN